MTTLISTFGLYLLKASLFSGILYAYYHFALRDKQTFGWNRFYLLAAVVLTVVIPLLNIPLHLGLAARQEPVLVHLLKVVPGTADNMDYAGPVVPDHARPFPWAAAAGIAYGAVAAALLGLFLFQLWKLSRLKKTATLRQLDDISLIGTDTPGTPFSFFYWIFWDNRLSLESDEGKRIFLHELAHVKGRHSLDKICLQILCALLFPVFPLYLIRRELQLVHEYQADYEATGRRDIEAYASYLVKHALNAPAYDLSNAFHQHPLLRRLAMMNNTGLLQGKASAWRRWMALPLLFCAFTLFAFSLKRSLQYTFVGHPGYSRTLTVVIDAGHGGTDPGAQANGMIEKNINLSIARAVARLAPGYPVKILLSRDVDSLVPIFGRIRFSDAHKADLFVSLHTNLDANPIKGASPISGMNPVTGGGPSGGIEAYVSSRNRFYDSSIVLGSLLLHRLGRVYPSDQVLREQARGISVLVHADCPSVLLECGYLDRKSDAAFMSDPASQEKIARQILESLSDYAGGTTAQALPIQHIIKH
jgi:N-acetylmuramoyl-L-alanine amidase